MSIRDAQCRKVCRILDDVLANRPTERDALCVAVDKAFEALIQSEQQRTGNWIPADSQCGIRCSVCGVPVDDFCHSIDYIDLDYEPNFCPNCGEKMNQSGETCDCYRGGRCVGTKEIDQCSCGDNKSKCDFYERVRRGGDAE